MADVSGYWAVLYRDPEDDTINVEFPDHPNIITYGNDREQAIEMAAEALNATLSAELDRCLPLPAPTKKPKVKSDREAVFVALLPEIRSV